MKQQKTADLPRGFRPGGKTNNESAKRKNGHRNDDRSISFRHSKAAKRPPDTH